MLCVLIGGIGCSETPPPVPANEEDLTIQQVTEIPGVDKRTLYEGAKAWVATTFSHDLDVIRYANRDNGIVVGKTYIPHARDKKYGMDQFGLKDKFEFRFTIMVETKDNRIRTTYSDMMLIGSYGKDMIYKEDMDVIRPQLEKAVELLVGSYKKAMPDDDW